MLINEIRKELALLSEVAPLEGQRYAACLHTYEAASNQRELILKWFADHVIPELSTDSASLLSVGCGAGDLDVEILTAGRKHAAAISYVGLEPDPDQCEKFVLRMQQPGDDTIQVEAHNTRFELFTEQRRFDVVIMVHSLYYMDNPEESIASALELLKEGGKLVLLIASNDKLNELSSSFWALENSGSTWFSEDLSGHLTARGLTFQRERIKATLDISSCLEPGSEQGQRIADFVAQVPTSQLPVRLRNMIFSYLESTAQRDGDVHWLPHNVDAFTIVNEQSLAPAAVA